MMPSDSQPITTLGEAVQAVLTNVFGPEYVAHWGDGVAAILETGDADDGGWTAGHALGGAFLLWLANAGDQQDALLEGLRTGGGSLHEMCIRTSEHTITVPGAKVVDWPDYAPLVPADATEVVANILLNPRYAALVSEIRLREDASGGSSLAVTYSHPSRTIEAVYGAPPAREAMLATERWLSGAALRAVSVALGELITQLQLLGPTAEPQPEAAADTQPSPADRLGAIGPEVEG